MPMICACGRTLYHDEKAQKRCFRCVATPERAFLELLDLGRYAEIPTFNLWPVIEAARARQEAV